MSYIIETLGRLVEQTAFLNLTVGNLIMIAVACVFLYLAINRGFEPLLLVPIAFGILLRTQKTVPVDFCIISINWTNGRFFRP